MSVDASHQLNPVIHFLLFLIAALATSPPCAHCPLLCIHCRLVSIDKASPNFISSLPPYTLIINDHRILLSKVNCGIFAITVLRYFHLLSCLVIAQSPSPSLCHQIRTIVLRPSYKSNSSTFRLPLTLGFYLRRTSIIPLIFQSCNLQFFINHSHQACHYHQYQTSCLLRRQNHFTASP